MSFWNSSGSSGGSWASSLGGSSSSLLSDPMGSGNNLLVNTPWLPPHSDVDTSLAAMPRRGSFIAPPIQESSDAADAKARRRASFAAAPGRTFVDRNAAPNAMTSSGPVRLSTLSRYYTSTAVYLGGQPVASHGNPANRRGLRPAKKKKQKLRETKATMRSPVLTPSFNNLVGMHVNKKTPSLALYVHSAQSCRT